MKIVMLVYKRGHTIRLPFPGGNHRFIAKDGFCFMYEGINKEMMEQYREIDLSLNWLDNEARDFIRANTL